MQADHLTLFPHLQTYDVQFSWQSLRCGTETRCTSCSVAFSCFKYANDYVPLFSIIFRWMRWIILIHFLLELCSLCIRDVFHYDLAYYKLFFYYKGLWELLASEIFSFTVFAIFFASCFCTSVPSLLKVLLHVNILF